MCTNHLPKSFEELPKSRVKVDYSSFNFFDGRSTLSKTISICSKCSKKMVSPKIITLKYDIFCVIGTDGFFFAQIGYFWTENEKWSSPKSTVKYEVFCKIGKRWQFFPKKMQWKMKFPVLSRKLIFFLKIWYCFILLVYYFDIAFLEFPGKP